MKREDMLRLHAEILREIREEEAKPQFDVSPDAQVQLVGLLREGRVGEFNKLRAQCPDGCLDLSNIKLEDIRRFDLRELDSGTIRVADIELIRKIICRHEQTKKLAFVRPSAANPTHGPYIDIYLVRCDKCGAEFEDEFPGV